MGFEIKKVLDMKINSIPVGGDKNIDISSLNNKDSREKLYSLLTLHFDKSGNKKGILESKEQEALYKVCGKSIDDNKLNRLLSKFKITIFPREQTTVQVDEKTRQKVKQYKIDLNSNDGKVREAAIDAAGKMGKKEMFAFIEALKDEDTIMRESAAIMLGIMEPKSKESVPALTAALKDNNTEVRDAATWALGMICPDAKESVPVLIGSLKDSDADVRARVAFVLGMVGRRGNSPNSIIHALKDALKDEDANVRREADLSIKKIMGRKTP